MGFDFDDHSEDKRNPQPKNSAKRIQENIFKIRRKRTIHGKNQRNAKIWNGACDGTLNRKIQECQAVVFIQSEYARQAQNDEACVAAGPNREDQQADPAVPADSCCGKNCQYHRGEKWRSQACGKHSGRNADK
jgi:hypothetical protein